GSRDACSGLDDVILGDELGPLLDIVHHHMAASHEIGWWVIFLENGRGSRFVHFFAIDWRRDKILLPILGKPYGEALESGEIRLRFEQDGFFITYYDKRLPLAPESYRLVLDRCADALPDELRELLGEEVANSRFLKETLWR